MHRSLGVKRGDALKEALNGTPNAFDASWPHQRAITLSPPGCHSKNVRPPFCSDRVVWSEKL